MAGRRFWHRNICFSGEQGGGMEPETFWSILASGSFAGEAASLYPYPQSVWFPGMEIMCARQFEAAVKEYIFLQEELIT